MVTHAQRTLIGLFFGLVGCTFARTQTVIEIRSDERVSIEASEIRIEARDANDAMLLTRSIHPMSVDFSGFPITIPVSAKNGDDSRTFEIRVTAIVNRRQPDGSVLVSTLAQNRLRTGFRRGHVLRFALWLLSSCRCDTETERCEPDADGDLVPECLPQTVTVRVDTTTPATELDGQVADASIDSSLDDGQLGDATVFDGSLAEAGLVCSAIQRMCDGRCVSRSSPIACGASCLRCDAIPGSVATCDNNSCGIECRSNTPDRCPSACVDFDSDSANCGSCGNACPSGRLCVQRQCQMPPQCTQAQDPACTGMTYCNLTARMCASGCDGRVGQCPDNRVCDVVSHTCGCSAPNRMCGNVCATCPSGANATGYACDNTSCIVAGCNAGYVRANSNTQCTDIDECSTNNGGCGAGACTNTAGSSSCSCSAPNRTCDGACVACPRDANASDFSCSGNSCHIAACRTGFSVNAQASACVATQTPMPTYARTASVRHPSSSTGGFAISTAMSSDGDTILVGVTATVFQRTSSGWTAGTTLASPLSAGHYGFNVALSGDGRTAFVGDPEGGQGNRGAVTVHRRTATGWGPAENTPRPPTAADYGFSISVSESGDRVAVGDPGGGDDTFGAVTVLRWSNPSWVVEAILPRPPAPYGFGGYVALSGDGATLVVRDVRGSADRLGETTVYQRDGTGWMLNATLSRPPATVVSEGTVAISRDGNVIAVASSTPDRVATLFVRTATGWSGGVAVARPFSAGEATACALSRDGSYLLVSDWNAGEDQNGAVAGYFREGSVWNMLPAISRPSGAVDFGISVAMNGGATVMAVGDLRGGGSSGGLVHLFQRQ